MWSSDSADDRSIATVSGTCNDDDDDDDYDVTDDDLMTSLGTVSGTYDPVFQGTFKQQVNFLLTSRERLQLTKAIQIYAQRR